jgi:hypothetical protein
MNSYERNEAEFLTTIEKWDLVELLARCGIGLNVLIAIDVRPRHTLTGLLEERGRWIRKIWEAVLSKIPDVSGHRMMWSQLLFVCRGIDIHAVETLFAEILQSFKAEELKSLCVLSQVGGGLDAKLAEVDLMFEGLSKERNFGDLARYERWLLDGERYAGTLSAPRNS